MLYKRKTQIRFLVGEKLSKFKILPETLLEKKKLENSTVTPK